VCSASDGQEYFCGRQLHIRSILWACRTRRRVLMNNFCVGTCKEAMTRLTF
jgi:hypothetical protein